MIYRFQKTIQLERIEIYEVEADYANDARSKLVELESEDTVESFEEVTDTNYYLINVEVPDNE